MENGISINWILLLFFLTPLFVFSQDVSKCYEFKTNMYAPRGLIKDALEQSFKDCLTGVNTEERQLQHCIRVIPKRDSLIITLTTSSKVIPLESVKWNTLNIIGAFHFKGRLVIIDAEERNFQQVADLFRKRRNKHIKITIPLDEEGEPMCGSNYLFQGKNLKLLNRVNTFKL
jgi:hypothetical protein